MQSKNCYEYQKRVAESNMKVYKMCDQTRESRIAFLKKYFELTCTAFRTFQNYEEVHILNTARLRRASQHYNLVRPGKVRVIWPDIYVSMALSQILCKLLKSGPNLAFKSPVGMSTNRTLGDALNLIRRKKRGKQRKEAIGKNEDIFKWQVEMRCCICYLI